MKEKDKFKKLINMVTSMDKNIKTIKKLIEVGDYVSICKFFADEKISITELKREELFVDRRGSGKYKTLVFNMKNNNLMNSEFKSYFEEIECFNDLFEESLVLQEKINKIPSKHILSLMLYYLDINLIELRSEINVKICEKEKTDYYINYDNCTSAINDVFKSLCYNKNIFNENKFLYPLKRNLIGISENNHKIINDYIDDSGSTGYIEIFLDLWKNDVVSITKEFLDFKIKIKNKEILFKNVYTQLKQKIYNLIYELPASINWKYKKTEKSKFICHSSIKMLEQYFCANIEDIVVGDIPIKEWVLAYYAIIDICIKNNSKLTHNRNKRELNLELYKTRKEWCKLIVKYGVTSSLVDIIFDKMTYGKNSTDLYDYPFVNIKGKYLVLGSMLMECSPALALISRFGKENLKIDFKGKNFENKFYSFCNNTNIKFVNLHNTCGMEEYECDAALYIDNTLIFCELKNKNQYRYNEIKSDDICADVDQLKRIYEFYKNNLDIVKNAFVEKYGIRFNKKIHLKMLVIYSRAVDGYVKKDGVLCIDYIRFITPFLPLKFKEYYLDDKIKNIFQQNISGGNLFKFYEQPFYVFNYRDRVRIHNLNINVGKYKIEGELARTEELITVKNYMEMVEYIKNLMRLGVKL